MLRQRSDPTVSKRGHFCSVPGRAKFNQSSVIARPVLGDLVSYTVAPIISWAILSGALRKIFAPRSVPQTFKNEFPASLVLRPTQLRAATRRVRSSFQLQHNSKPIIRPWGTQGKYSTEQRTR